MSYNTNNQQTIVVSANDFQQLVNGFQELTKKVGELSDLLESRTSMEDEVNGFITVPIVLRLYHFKSSTLYMYLSKPDKYKLPAYKVGGMWLFKKEELDQWVMSHRYDDGMEEAEAQNAALAATFRRKPKYVNI